MVNGATLLTLRLPPPAQRGIASTASQMQRLVFALTICIAYITSDGAAFTVQSPPTSSGSSWSLGSATSKASAMNAVNSDPVLKQLARAGGSSLSLDQFNSWAITHGYDFNPSDVEEYKQNFKANMGLVVTYTLDNSTKYWAGANRFAHLSVDLFGQGLKAKALKDAGVAGGRRSLLHSEEGDAGDIKRPLFDMPILKGFSRAARVRRKSFRQLLADPPPSVDWVQQGMITPIRDQYADVFHNQASGLSGCGSCFAFAAVSAIETAYLFKQQKNTSSVPDIHLSEEQILGCCNSIFSASLCPVSDGCSGGSIEEAVSYAAANVLMTSSRNPYTSGSHSSSSGTNSACNQGPVPSGQGLKLSSGAVPITPRSRMALIRAVAQYPVLVYVDSQHSDFMLYSGGIFSSGACSETFTNHAMLVVGYDLNAQYWLVKNSFGSGWGDKGYARIAMTADGFGTCGMYTRPLQVLPNFDPSFDTLTNSPPTPPTPPAIPPAAPPVVRWPANCYPGNTVGTRGFAWSVSITDSNASTLTLLVTRNQACDPTMSGNTDRCCQSSIAHLQILMQPGCRGSEAALSSPDLPDAESLVAASTTSISNPQPRLEIELPGAGVPSSSAMKNFTIVIDISKSLCSNLPSFFQAITFKTYQFAAFGNDDACCGTGIFTTIKPQRLPPSPPPQVDCQVSWSGWSTCTATCGGGQQSRSGTVTKFAANGGKTCPALTETQTCNTLDCQAKPVDCNVTWQAWSSCSVSCGGGYATRIGTVTTPASNGGTACPSLLQTQACNPQACQPPSVDCVVSWSSWSTCNAACGGGQATRTGTVTQQPSNGGSACPSLSQTQSCNTETCPRADCQVSWSNWSTCTATCSSGQQTRTGTVSQQPANGGAACPALTQTQSCNTQPCPPVNCQVSWSVWTTCNAACGGGLQSRSGTITQQAQYGGTACPSLSQVQACNQQACSGSPPPSPPPPIPPSFLTNKVSITYRGSMTTLANATAHTRLAPYTCMASPGGLVYLCYFGSKGLAAGISGGGLFTKPCKALTPDLCRAQATCPGTGGALVRVDGVDLCQYWTIPCSADGATIETEGLILQTDGNICCRGCNWCRCGCSYAPGNSFTLTLEDTGSLAASIFHDGWNGGNYWDVASSFNVTPGFTVPFTAFVAYKGSMTRKFNSTDTILKLNTCMSSPNGAVYLCYFGSRGLAAGMTAGGLFAKPCNAPPAGRCAQSRMASSEGSYLATCPGIGGTLVNINGMALCQYWTLPCAPDGALSEYLVLQGDGNICIPGCGWCRCGCSFATVSQFSMSLTNAGSLYAVIDNNNQQYWDLASAFNITPNLLG